jgi:ribosomal RNA-processing protein 36
MQAFANTRLANGAGRLGVIAPLVPVDQPNKAGQAANGKPKKKAAEAAVGAVAGQKRKRAADALFAADDEEHQQGDEEEEEEEEDEPAAAIAAKSRAGKAPPQPPRSKHRGAVAAADDADEQQHDDDGDDAAARSKKRRTAPEERSFKKPVAAGLSVTALPGYSAERHRRDPRFDSLCGEFNPTHFHGHYAWMAQEKETEIAAWQAELRSGKKSAATLKGNLSSGGGGAVKMSDEEREELRGRIQQAQQELAALKRDKGENALLQQWKSSERKLQKETGKKPFHLKASEQKKLKLASRFLDLQQQGKLQKFMQKKTKEVANRDHRYMPHEGRE